MLTLSILIIPILGIFTIATNLLGNSKYLIKCVGLSASLINLIITLVIFILFDFSNNQFQFIQEHYNINGYNIYLGIDGLSIYFVLLTAIIMPVAILSNWNSINTRVDNVTWYIIIMLLLETLLLAVFLVLDIFLFYISFESILPPLFLLIGIFGSSNKVRASFYLFLYTLLGSLFLLLSILTIYSIMGTTDYHALFNKNFEYTTQLFLFYGIFIAFAVKTPTIFLNTWLLKAHVESPLGGSIVLAGIVLKLSLYGILRLILPILPKASLDYTYVVYLIGVISIIYASFSTLRTVDVKELIAYSSVSHAAVYLLGVFSNTLQGIGGGVILGLAHGFVSSGLFMCTGGVLYDRTSTRLITYYRGITQIMPLFSIIFFILCLSNAGTPLSLNFVGEFLSLYGTFERLPLMGVLASSSIVLSAAYTMYMFNRISFGGTLSKYFKVNIPDFTKREFILLLTLVILTVVLGVYPSVIIDGLNFGLSTLIYSCYSTPLYNDSPAAFLCQQNINPQLKLIELHNNIMFYLFIGLLTISWISVSIMRHHYSKILNRCYKYLYFGTIGKYILALIPAIMITLIAFPSFKLLYLMDEITDPNLAIFLENKQLKWNYHYLDMASTGEGFYEYDSYVLSDIHFADNEYWYQYDIYGNVNGVYPLENPNPNPNDVDIRPYLYEFFEKAKLVYDRTLGNALRPTLSQAIDECRDPPMVKASLGNFYWSRIGREFNYDSTRITGHRRNHAPMWELYNYLHEQGYNVTPLQGKKGS